MLIALECLASLAPAHILINVITEDAHGPGDKDVNDDQEDTDSDDEDAGEADDDD